MTMRPSASAGRASCLAVNPHNREASAARRERLLAAFRSLDDNTQADLLEAAESWTGRAASGVDFERNQAWEIIRATYAAAGWEA